MKKINTLVLAICSLGLLMSSASAQVVLNLQADVSGIFIPNQTPTSVELQGTDPYGATIPSGYYAPEYQAQAFSSLTFNVPVSSVESANHSGYPTSYSATTGNITLTIPGVDVNDSTGLSGADDESPLATTSYITLGGGGFGPIIFGLNYPDYNFQSALSPTAAVGGFAFSLSQYSTNFPVFQSSTGYYSGLTLFSTGSVTPSVYLGYSGANYLGFQTTNGIVLFGISSNPSGFSDYSSLPYYASGQGGFTVPFSGEFQAVSTPEPSSTCLLLLGLPVVAWMLRRRAFVKL